MSQHQPASRCAVKWTSLSPNLGLACYTARRGARQPRYIRRRKPSETMYRSHIIQTRKLDCWLLFNWLHQYFNILRLPHYSRIIIIIIKMLTLFPFDMWTSSNVNYIKNQNKLHFWHKCFFSSASSSSYSSFSIAFWFFVFLVTVARRCLLCIIVVVVCCHRHRHFGVFNLNGIGFH